MTTSVKTYKLCIHVDVSFHQDVEVEATSYAQAVAKATKIYEEADVCRDWECNHMDFSVESIDD
jgi:hypothetical protein